MQTVTVSPKFQIGIPKDIRKAMRLRPGQKLKVIAYEGRIELIPDRDIFDLKGFLKGINTDFERERGTLGTGGLWRRTPDIQFLVMGAGN